MGAEPLCKAVRWVAFGNGGNCTTAGVPHIMAFPGDAFRGIANFI